MPPDWGNGGIMKSRVYFWMEKFKTIKWSFGLAWKINKGMLVLWMTLSIGLSVLPAVSLTFNNKIINILSEFLANTVAFEFHDIVPQILGLGITMIFIGISARVNGDLIYMMMYDSYYLGMEELLMDKLQKVEIADLLKRKINDEYNYIVGRAGSLTDLMSGACALVGKIVSIISLLLVALSASEMVFIISLLYVCIIFMINFSFIEKTRWDTNEYRKVTRVADYYENMVTNSGTAKEIRIFESENYIVKQWKEAFSEVKKFQKRRNYDIELRNLLSGAGFYIFLIIMILINLYLLAEGSMPVSVFLMLFTLCINIYIAISGLAREIMSFDYGLFALERQRKFILNIPAADSPKEKVSSKAEKGETVFDLKNISFSYGEGNKVLNNISFQVKKGEVIALVGRNGSGKSTLVKLLLGMFRPLSGSIELYGVPYDKYTSKEIRDRIGVFFQDFWLFHTSIKENVAYGDVDNMHDEEMIIEAIKKGGAEKLVRKLQNGIHTILGKQIYREGVELSGGEKQRIGVSRAHMSSKEIIIFDEPASALDPVAEAEQFMNIKEKLDGRTAVLVSHRIGFCRLADKIVLLDNGRMIESGSHEELLQKNGAYARFYNEQAEWYEKTDSHNREFTSAAN